MAVQRGAFCQFLSGGFITTLVVNPLEISFPERKLTKRTSALCSAVQCSVKINIHPIVNTFIKVIVPSKKFVPILYRIFKFGDRKIPYESAKN